MHVTKLLYTTMCVHEYIYTYEDSWKSQEPVSLPLAPISHHLSLRIHDDFIPSEPHDQLQTTEDQEATTSDQSHGTVSDCSAGT